MLLIKKEGPAARPRARSIRRFPIFMQEQGIVMVMEPILKHGLYRISLLAYLHEVP